jgi:hypothetical protein
MVLLSYSVSGSGAGSPSRFGVAGGPAGGDRRIGSCLRFDAAFGGYSRHAGNKPRPSAGPSPRSALAKAPRQPLLPLSPIRQRVETRPSPGRQGLQPLVERRWRARNSAGPGNTARPGRPSKGNQHGRRAWPHHRHSSQHRPAALRAPVQHRDQGRLLTTKFAAYVVVFAGILLASFLVKTGQDGQRPDYFPAEKPW